MHFESKSKEQKEELIFCYGGWDRDLEPGVQYGPVIRDVYVIECCTAGFGSAIINGREFPVGPGDCYFLLPGDTVIHTADRVQPRSGVFCYVEGLRVGSYLSQAGITSENPYAPKEAFGPICELVEELVQRQDEADPGGRLRQVGCLYQLFGELLRHCKAEPDRSLPIRKAMKIIETCYPRPLSVSQIASEVGLERCYFSTQFKSHTGLSPYQYLTKLRILRAAALMEHEGLSVATAAVAVGIPPENFSRIFKKWMKMSPGQYRTAKK